MKRKRSWTMIYTGNLLMGSGFILIGLAHTATLIMFAAMYAGFVGPINDLAYMDMTQKHFEVKDIAKIFRLRLAIESLGTLFFTLISPMVIMATSVRFMIIASGVIWLVNASIGLSMKKFRQTI